MAASKAKKSLECQKEVTNAKLEEYKCKSELAAKQYREVEPLEEQFRKQAAQLKKLRETNVRLRKALMVVVEPSTLQKSDRFN